MTLCHSAFVYNMQPPGKPHHALCCPLQLPQGSVHVAGLLIPIPIPMLQGLKPSPALACEPLGLMRVLNFGTLPLRVSLIGLLSWPRTWEAAGLEIWCKTWGLVSI